MMLSSFVIYTVCVVYICHAASLHKTEPVCGYQSCPAVKDDMINVHLVPHTHDDVGWLKTVDQYYYGARNNIQNAGVQYILDSVIPELLNDPSKRFIYVEIAFFARWWREQDDSMRHIVKGLVNSGRLEFILGGWCMNDEASTHYNAIIDQHALGFEFLRQNFGECGRPRIGWQIDPFGHSREQASLFAQFGFDGLFFGRLDFEDKEERMKETTLEMLWHGSPNNLGEKSDLFTGVLYNGYGPPGGFCFDIFCQDEPIKDNKHLHDYNVDDRVKDFIKAVEEQALHYKTNHIIMTMGSDFQYQDAHHWYKNMDKLIKYTNMLQETNHSNINVLYSTPSCYLHQLNLAGIKWPTKGDDFFPYAHRNHSFWTGYFTSRAALKGYVRETNTFLQACKQLDAIAMLDEYYNTTYEIQVLKEAMGVAQHHDAVSGTEKQQVAYDYAERLAHGRASCQRVMNDAFMQLMPKLRVGFPGVVWCDLMNISACNHTEINKQFILVIYNPLGHDVTRWLRLPVLADVYTVNGPHNEPIQTQIIPIDARTKSIPERKGHMALNTLVFQVSVPPLGFSTYFISKTPSYLIKKENTKEIPKKVAINIEDKIVMKNKHTSLEFNSETGRLSKLRNLNTGIDIDIQEDIVFYYSHPGNCSTSDLQPSGAYIFRPNNTTPQVWQKSYPADNIKGPLVQETYTVFSDWVTQVTRLYEDEKYAEIEWTVGPIPIDDKYGKEVVARFNTTLASNKIFYTDANGREVLMRERNYRPTWKLNQTEPVAGNYYPVNSRIYIQDKEKNIQFTVMTDRSEGGASIYDGQIELMLHRRTLHDDCLGVGEPLNETGSDGKGLIVRGKMYIFMDTIDNSAKMHRDFGLKTYMAPIPSFVNSEYKYSEYSQNYHTIWSGLTAPLPPNVHLLTLEQWKGPAVTPSSTQPYLIRLEHIYEKDEDAELSKPVTISLQDMFVRFEIESIEELTLGANLPLTDLHRLKWQTMDTEYVSDTETAYKVEKRDPLPGTIQIELSPMEIRTFQLTIKGGLPSSYIDKFTVFS